MDMMLVVYSIGMRCDRDCLEGDISSGESPAPWPSISLAAGLTRPGCQAMLLELETRPGCWRWAAGLQSNFAVKSCLDDDSVC